uniref:Uncharacterized protein n=1 Tax=Ditylenchus dipsaci TaxID=166011 RepID=A0A915DY05_9BILA
MMVKRDADNNQGANTSLIASRHSLKRFRAFKSHKSDKQNIRSATDEIDGTANLPSTSSSSSSALQLLNRPIEKVYEEAQFSLTLNLNDRKLKELPEELAHKYDLSDLICAGQFVAYKPAKQSKHLLECSIRSPIPAICALQQRREDYC